MRIFNDLTLDEWKKVFNRNEQLQRDVFDDALESANYWIGKYFACFDKGAIDFNIGYPGNYVTILDDRKFIDGLEKLQRNFGYLSADSTEKIAYCAKLLSHRDYLPYTDYINEERLTNRIDELIDELRREFLRELVNEYDYYFDNKNLIDYFVEIYAEVMNDNYYINDDFTLFQHIEYEKSYA